jgi:tripartite-type tricarboxylate transporter receptor subunit TctC
MKRIDKISRALTDRRTACTAIASLVLLPTLCTAQAANWPTRTVRIIVGYPPGSSPDMVARLLAVPLARTLGQSVIIENRAGANGAIGAQAVAAGDDHVIGIMPNAPLVTAPLLNPKLPYVPGRDLLPISLLATTPFALTTGAGQPADPLAFIAAARAAGDKWSFGSSGAGSAAHLGMEVIQRSAGWRAVHVPYQGNPAVVTALISGEIQMALLPPSAVQPFIAGGRLRVIGLTGSRSVLMPSAPSLREYGLRGVEVEGFLAAATGRAMAEAQRLKIARILESILQEAGTRQKLFEIGWKAVGSLPDALGNRIAQDASMYGTIIRMLGIAEK